MRILTHSILAIAIICTITGCNKKQEATINEMSARLKVCEDSISTLRNENQALKSEIVRLNSVNPKDIPVDLITGKIDSWMSNVISNKLTETALRIFNDRIGTAEDIEFIFRQAVQDELAMVDERKKQEEAEAAETRQREWTERRKNWEQQRADRMAQQIGLAEEQKEPFSKIRTESNTRIQNTMREIWNEKGMDVNAMREARIAIKQETEEQMREILTEEQFTSYTNTHSRETRWIRRMESLFTEPDAGNEQNRSNR